MKRKLLALAARAWNSIKRWVSPRFKKIDDERRRLWIESRKQEELDVIRESVALNMISASMQAGNMDLARALTEDLESKQEK